MCMEKISQKTWRKEPQQEVIVNKPFKFRAAEGQEVSFTPYALETNLE